MKTFKEYLQESLPTPPIEKIQKGYMSDVLNKEKDLLRTLSRKYKKNFHSFQEILQQEIDNNEKKEIEEIEQEKQKKLEQSEKIHKKLIEIDKEVKNLQDEMKTFPDEPRLDKENKIRYNTEIITYLNTANKLRELANLPIIPISRNLEKYIQYMDNKNSSYDIDIQV